MLAFILTALGAAGLLIVIYFRGTREPEIQVVVAVLPLEVIMLAVLCECGLQQSKHVFLLKQRPLGPCVVTGFWTLILEWGSLGAVHIRAWLESEYVDRLCR